MSPPAPRQYPAMESLKDCIMGSENVRISRHNRRHRQWPLDWLCGGINEWLPWPKQKYQILGREQEEVQIAEKIQDKKVLSVAPGYSSKPIQESIVYLRNRPQCQRPSDANRPPSLLIDDDTTSVPSKVIPYPQNAIYPRSGSYTVTVNGISVDCVSLTSYDYVHFSLSPVDGRGVMAKVVITLKDGNELTKYRLSPNKLNLQRTTKNNTLAFTLKSHSYVIAQLNKHREILILCDPAETNAPPPRGSGVFNVADPVYGGADNTGKQYATSAFQRALNSASAAASASKQAIVYIPSGLFLLENIILPSNTALYLAPGAVLRFSGVHAHYVPHWHKTSQQRDITWWISTAFNSSNIRIYGRGTIDGNGWTSTKTSNPRIGNNILVPIACNGFQAEGITVRDSGSWSVTPIRCTNLSFDRVKMLNRLDMGENDCIDPMECTNVTVTNCIGVSLDDPFSTKTWAEDTDIAHSWPGKPQPQSNILFANCMSWTRCFGYKVGQGVCQQQSNITFRDCVVYDAAVGLGINHRYGRAAAQDILFQRCDVERVSLTLVGRRTWFANFTEMGSAEYGVGPVRRVLIDGVTVWDRGTTRVEMRGMQGAGTIDGVVFKDVRMKDLQSGDRPDGKARTYEELGLQMDQVKNTNGLQVIFS